MSDETSEKLLLQLALHRYDEEVQRNELIDSKNKSIVAFLGVMLTIQCQSFQDCWNLEKCYLIQKWLFCWLFS